MSTFRKQIEETERALEAQRAKLREQQHTIGAYLYSNEQETLQGLGLSESAQKIEEIDRAIGELDEQLNRIDTASKRLQSIQAERRELQQNLESLSQDMARHHEAIGRVGFSLYRENPFIDQRFVNIFSDLVKNQEDIRELERELSQAGGEQDQKAFFERVVSRGKLALLRNRKNAKEAATTGLYRKAGQQLVQTDFIETVDDPELSRTAEPYLKLREQYDRQHERLKGLDDEAANLNEELRELGVGSRGSSRRIEEIEAEKRQHREQKQHLLATFGARYAESLGQDAEVPEAIRDALNELREADAQLREKQEYAERLYAAAEVERLDGELSRMEQRAGQLQSRVDELQRQLGELNQNIEETKQEKTRQEERRGTLEDLQPGSGAEAKGE
jgi:chromosome segregation ATPase